MDNLTGEEFGRFQRLQEICPQDDPSDLYEAAAPYLKADESFNCFLNDLMESKLLDETEDDQEETKINESPVLASSSQVPEAPNDRPTKPLKKRLISSKREGDVVKKRRPSDRSDLDNVESEQDMTLNKNVSDLLRKSVENESEPENRSFSPEKSENIYDRVDERSKIATDSLNGSEKIELILKKEDGISLNDEENSEVEISSDADRIESKDPIAKMTNSAAIPKTEIFLKIENQNRPSTSRDVDVEETSTQMLTCNFTEKASGDRVQNYNLVDKSETQDLKIPEYPFVYVVSETYSPAFRLPKGNYLITNTVPSAEALEPGFNVLHHPSNGEERIRSEPERESPKKPEIFSTEKESPIPRKTFAKVVPFNPDESTLESPKRETEKTLVSNRKENVFPSTSRQSLTEESEIGNYSYVSVLHSVANNFKSPQNNTRKNASSEDDTPGSDPEIQVLLPPTKKTNRKASEDAVNVIVVDDEEGGNSSDDPYLTLMTALKDSDPEYIKKELENCGNDVQLQKKVIEKEMERNRLSDIETQSIRNGWLKLINQLPELDPDYLLTKWTEIACDDAVVDALIQEERAKLDLDKIKKHLFSNLPLLDRRYLETKAKEFLSNPEGLDSFINEERVTMLVEEQYKNMVALLPGMDPVLLRQKCEEFQGNSALVEEYVQVKMFEDERSNQIANMQLILPDADPAFLEQKFLEFPGNSEAFNNFLFGLLERKDYPKVKKDDPASRERAEWWRRYVDNFDVKDFLEKIPDPEEHYRSQGENKTDIKLIIKFLQFRYPDSSAQHLEKVFRERGNNLTDACTQLDTQLKPVEMMDVSFRNESFTESFLLEMVFLLRQREILEHLRQEKELRDLKLAEARIQNSLLTCSCCYEDELLENEVTACPEGHIVCVKCVTRYVQLKLGEGLTKFTCTTEDCGTEFILAILEKILPRNLYVKVLRKKQSAEVSEAGVSGLESCPSCDFAYIPTQDDKIFRCQNPDCMRETCRKCKEDNHVPLRCEEVEKPKDTQVRTSIEEKMTEALLRTCHKCGKKFIRNQGCNVMTCVCGAMMCYVCRKPLKRHGCGCPAYNDNDLHTHEVRTAAQIAREQALRENPDVNLVHDPTKTV